MGAVGAGKRARALFREKAPTPVGVRARTRRWKREPPSRLRGPRGAAALSFFGTTSAAAPADSCGRLSAFAEAEVIAFGPLCCRLSDVPPSLARDPPVFGLVKSPALSAGRNSLLSRFLCDLRVLWFSFMRIQLFFAEIVNIDVGLH